MTTIETSYTLIKVYDLRPWDIDTNSYADIDDDCKSMCSKCGRLHAKVYVVKCDQTSKEFEIGGGCARKHLGGWTPDKELVKRLEKESKELAKNVAHQKLLDVATPIAAAVNAMVAPTQFESFIKKVYSREIPATRIVGTDIDTLCQDGIFTSSKKTELINSWKSQEIKKFVEGLSGNESYKYKIRMLTNSLLGIY